MTFRTTVRDGLVVFNTHGQIPDGTPVEILPMRSGGTRRVSTAKTASSSARAAKSRVSARKKTVRSPDFGFGMWKHRRDIGDTAAFARELRRRSSTRKRDV